MSGGGVAEVDGVAFGRVRRFAVTRRGPRRSERLGGFGLNDLDRKGLFEQAIVVDAVECGNEAADAAGLKMRSGFVRPAVQRI